ncbi:pirin family protein [Aurantivibrio plasticivorans]
MYIRQSHDRGTADFGWLHSRHSFSFGSYYDANHMGFGVLRVINDDRVAPGGGFDTHGHRDMEIISYPLSGALEHKDSLGNGSVIRTGDVQRMSAGTGVLHSEFNPSSTEASHFLQIWILPNQTGLEPSYEQQHFSEQQRRNRLLPIVSGRGIPNTLKIHQDATLYSGLFSAGHVQQHAISGKRKTWVHVAEGCVTLSANGVDEAVLNEGDSVGLQHDGELVFQAQVDSNLLVFDLPA